MSLLRFQKLYNFVGKLQFSAKSNTKNVVNSFCQRTHNCGELCEENVGETVKLYGWVEFQRMKKFLTLRDSYGSTQIILPKTSLKLKPESIVKVEGVVCKRPEGQKNSDMKTGNIEINANQIELLNECLKFPFSLKNSQAVNFDIRQRYRYFDLRSKEMQNNLRTRSKILFKMRQFLCKQNGFVDIETPTLFRRTPGGAKEFIVPSHCFPKHVYSLPQSPQQFKQLLMVGGIDRYMQIARCYRDETAKSDRQPEFTQLDLEMSFVNKNDIMNLTENLLEYSWPYLLDLPFQRINFQEALENFGNDKPDLRISNKIMDVSDDVKISGECIRAINIKNGCNHFSPIDLLNLVEDNTVKLIPIEIKNENWWSEISNEYPVNLIRKFNVENTDYLLICVGKLKPVCLTLGKIRTAYANLMEDKNLMGDAKKFCFCWVENFPLFEIENEKFVSCHHPFTSPIKEDEHLLWTNPELVHGNHYDLVLNGQEVGGGSVRIHQSSVQRYVIEKILNEDSSSLSHLLNALDTGAPPHAGIALGLDRLLAILCGAKTIKDVIAFPKTNDGKDLMSNTPSLITDADYNYYLKHFVEKLKLK